MVPTDEGVDGVVRGEIQSISLQPVGVNDQQLASRARVTVMVKVKFEDVKEGKTLWENPALSFSDEYELANPSAGQDVSAFVGNDRIAMDRLPRLRAHGCKCDPRGLLSTVAEIRKIIQSGKTGPLYLLESDDLQSRHDLAIEFAGIVDEGLQAFNVQSFYANEATNAPGRDQLIGSLLSNARTLPMMAPRRVIVVHEADRLLAPKRAKDDEEGEVEVPKKGKRVATTPAEELEAYIEQPEPMTTLIFVSGPLDEPPRREASGSTPTSSTWRADLRWGAGCGSEAARKGRVDDPKAISLLLSSTGLTLGRIRPEIDKLILYAAGESTITAAHVKDVVIPQEESEGTFALMDAVRNANAPRALREISALIDSGIQPPMILGQLRAATIQLRGDQRVKNGLEAVFRTDLAIKSSSGTPQYLLECLVVELCAR